MLKSVVSSWYDSHRCLSMLKVLFRDMVTPYKLSQCTSTIDLLNDLDASDYLSSENLTLLHDTIKTTKSFGLLKEIRKSVPTFPEIVQGGPIVTFTIHRQQLMKFGTKLKSGYIASIDSFYNSPLKKYADGWNMISDLEDRLEIREENMDEFIKTLNRLNVPLAVNALTEGISSGNKRRNIDSSDEPERKLARITPKIDLTTGVIDSAGGHLELANIKLDIPKGALVKGELVEISLGHVKNDAYDVPVSNNLESRISPIVTCKSSDTVFKKPCSLSFPHNAVNEECWKFTVLVGDCSSSTWKRTEGDDQYNISVRKGRCYIETKYFSDFTLLGLIRDALYCKRSLNLGLFGKYIQPQVYSLKIRIWNEYDNKLVLEDENKMDEKKLDVYPQMFAMYKDMVVIIDNLNNGLQIEGDTKLKLEAPLLWSSNPSHEFRLKIKDTSIKDLHARISTSQGSGHIHERPLHTPLNLDRPASSSTNTPHSSSTY